jgi:COP9 signalosome complex subunit 6
VRDVHKAPALDLVGWFTLLPTSGPSTIHLELQGQISKLAEGLDTPPTVLLGFHPTQAVTKPEGGALPITVYEWSDDEPSTGKEVPAGKEVEMTDSQASEARGVFKIIPYTIESSEAERIAVDSVARGSGNATAVPPVAAARVPQSAATIEEKSKGKKRTSDSTMKESEEPEAPKELDPESVLSPADQEQIAALTAKANAVKMLQSRIELIRQYLLTVSTPAEEQLAAGAPAPITPDPSLLRSILALLSRLPLVIPPSSNDTYRHDLTASQNDASIVALLNTLLKTTAQTRDLTRKFKVIETQRRQNEADRRGEGGGGYGPPSYGQGSGSGSGFMMGGGGGGGGEGGGGGKSGADKVKAMFQSLKQSF